MIVIVQERAGGDGDGDSDDDNDESGDGNYDGDSDEDVHVWTPFQQNKKLRSIPPILDFRALIKYSLRYDYVGKVFMVQT